MKFKIVDSSEEEVVKVWLEPLENETGVYLKAGNDEATVTVAVLGEDGLILCKNVEGVGLPVDNLGRIRIV